VDPLVIRSGPAAAVFWGSVGFWLLTGARCLRGGGGERRSDRGTAWLIVGSIALSFAGGNALAANLPGLHIPGEGWVTFGAAVAMLWAGFLCGELAARELGRFYRPVVAIQEGHQVVTSGPYRFVRHPLYAGAIVALAGAGLAFGNWASLALCLLAPAAAYVPRIRIEERALERELGEPYRAYAASKPRLFPGVW
jgi:protein-S-isoprenylcysteine O-methyltransferase Ste14